MPTGATETGWNVFGLHICRSEFYAKHRCRSGCRKFPVFVTKLKPRWNLHLRGDEDWLGRHSKALLPVPKPRSKWNLHRPSYESLRISPWLWFRLSWNPAPFGNAKLFSFDSEITSPTYLETISKHGTGPKPPFPRKRESRESSSCVGNRRF